MPADAGAPQAEDLMQSGQIAQHENGRLVTAHLLPALHAALTSLYQFD